MIAIVEGEVAIIDAAGNAIVRHGASRFLGELNLLSGQTVFVTAVVTQSLRYIAVDRDALRSLLFEDGALSDLLLATFIARRKALQRIQGIGLEIVGPRASKATMRMIEFARSNRLPFVWRDADRAAELDAADLPLVRLPGGAELHGPSTGQVRVRWGSAASSPRERWSTCSSSAAGPQGLAPRSTAPPRVSRRSW